MIAYVLINVKRESEREVLDAMRKIEGVKEAHAIHGVYDLVGKVEPRPVYAIYDIIGEG